MGAAEAWKAADRLKKSAARLVGALGLEIEVTEHEHHRRADLAFGDFRVGRVLDHLDEADDFLFGVAETGSLEHFADSHE